MTSENESMEQYNALRQQQRNGHAPAEPVPVETLGRRMSSFRKRRVRWGWTGRLALGYLTIESGEEGLGKSVFNNWLLARVTRGELDGIWHGKPVSAMVVASEDGAEDMWHPRLDAAGADTDRVVVFSLDDLPPGWNVRDGIDDLRRVVTHNDVRLIVFDSLLDNMPPAVGGENINSPTFVRGALAPLKQLVRELGIVALLSLHPPKGKGVAYRDFVQGSQAFSALTRTGLLFGWHPDDPEELGDENRRRVLLRGKGNLGRNPGALEFRIVGRDIEFDDGTFGDIGVVVDVQPSDMTFRRLTGRHEPDRTATKIEEATDLLRDHLAGGEWHPSAPVDKLLESLDLGSGSVVTAARREAGVESRKNGFGGWEIRIPSRARDEHSTMESWSENTPDPQCPREDSNFPSVLTTVPLLTANGRERTVADLSDNELLSIFPGSSIERDQAGTGV